MTKNTENFKECGNKKSKNINLGPRLICSKDEKKPGRARSAREEQKKKSP